MTVMTHLHRSARIEPCATVTHPSFVRVIDQKFRGFPLHQVLNCCLNKPFKSGPHCHGHDERPRNGSGTIPFSKQLKPLTGFGLLSTYNIQNEDPEVSQCIACYGPPSFCHVRICKEIEFTYDDQTTTLLLPIKSTSQAFDTSNYSIR